MKRPGTSPDREDALDPGDLPTPVRVVGIGASAGGLEALRVLVRHLPLGQGACFAIAQHLSPTHRSMLVDLIAREAQVQVLEIIDGMCPSPDHLYVTPAGYHVRLAHGCFVLEPVTQPGIPKPSIDEFFTSLALELGNRALGVILSGTGSDGARGVRAIHAANGYTIAQDPAEAKYDGMPRAAIETDCIDAVSPVADIGERLERWLKASHGSAIRYDDEDLALPVIQQIAQVVKRRAGFDLSLYKTRSLERRIRRRVIATESKSLEDYAQLVRTSPDEVERVVREMFISVTQFFRDPEAFRALNTELGSMLESKPDAEELRVWVPGCATGEEAYSLAMLIAEQFERLQRWPSVRLFATDLDLPALAKARKGIFHVSALPAIPAELAAKYLITEGDTCRIVKRLRDMVIFSEHNILADPPFLRLDLVSCRNLLIYLQPDVQERVLQTFAQALKSTGLLLLGKAEALHSNLGLFQVIDSESHLYRSNGLGNHRPRVAVRAPERSATLGTPDGLVTKKWDIGAWITNAHAQGVLAPFVMVNDAGVLLHVFGNVTPYLRLNAGLATLDILKLVIEPIRLELRSTLLQAQRQSDQRVCNVVLLDQGQRRIELIATRREEPGTLPMTLLLFHEMQGPPMRLGDEDAQTQHNEQRLILEAQLTATRDHLNTVISELESANEELQSLNEEMQSANEEMQSANEELETSNEELQSTNEELITVNEELESRSAELSLLNADLHNVKNSLIDPLIVVDEHRRVTLYNPPATAIFALDTDALGALLFSLPCHIELGDISSTLNEVIRKGTMLEVQIVGQRSYRMRAQPYRNLSGECKGAVLTFHDITDMLSTAREMARSHERLQRAERFTQATINALTKLIGVMDDQGVLVSANRHWVNAQADGNRCTLGCKEGGNLLLSCVQRAAQGDSSAAEMLQGLQRTMRGTSTTHEQVFPSQFMDPCPIFRVVVRPFEDFESGSYWVIACEDITQRILSQKQLALQARALNASWSAITIADARQPDMPVVYANDAFITMTGYALDEILGKNCRILQGTDRVQPGLAAIRESLASGQSGRALLRNYRKDGTLFWNELTLSPIVEDGVVTHVVGMQRDMTAKMAAESALKASLERESQALEFAGLGSFEVDIRRSLVSLSHRHAHLIGLSREEQDLSMVDFQNMILTEDRPSFADGLKVCLAGHALFDLEYRLRRPDGSLLWLHSRGNAVLNEQGLATRLLGLSQDITARKNSEENMRFIAHHDALTRLPNRALLRDRFQLAINGARRGRTRVALMFIDLDLFKDVNDTLGHDIGDQLLVSVADRMQLCVRDTDTICRQSGDEFIALLPGVRDHNDAARLAEKLIQSIAKPHFIKGHELRVTCSAGISIFPDDGDNIDDLMRHADSAMYHAKGIGRNAIEFFSKNMNVRQQERLSINTALRKAVERQELVLHYQPQFSISSGALIGIEALVRWQHPQRGLIMPAQFIDIAEESDLISEIGDWVLREACLQARRWQDAGLPKVPMAVNVSPVQMRQRRIIGSVTAALQASGLDPQYLEIELTERAIIHNLDEVRDLMADFRRDGVRLVLDDFGTGYSSLSALHRFPVDKLKIDRSFIADSVTDPGAAAIVRAVIHLAGGMSLDIVAEGVESAAQLSFLRTEGCGAFQGFLAAQGCPAEDLREVLSAKRPWHPETLQSQ